MFLQILPSQQAGDGLTYPHLARVDTGTQHTTFLTSGPMVVRDILAWDQVTSGHMTTVLISNWSGDRHRLLHGHGGWAAGQPAPLHGGGPR